MKNNAKDKFLDSFPDHQYRYIDQTGAGRPPVSSATRRDDLNELGYEAYFTVNGFKDAPDAKKDHCSSINAFFIDIDGRKDLKEIEDIKKRLEPTYILETKNGYHVYWLLDEVIFKDEVFGSPSWDEIVARWERLEQTIVTTLKADSVVKDLTRILRIPNTFYWKKSGDAYKKGTDNAPFKIKGIHKNLSANYSMDEIEEAFPPVQDLVTFNKSPNTNDNLKAYAEQQKKDFFTMVNAEYPIDERPSFKKLINGSDDSSLPYENCANNALIVTASLMKQAGWSKAEALEHLKRTGWHGIEKERGGWQEITNTVNSAYQTGYVYSYKNEFISYNMTPEETHQMQNAYTAITKQRKEIDKTRFANYEYEIVARYPYLKKNEVGIIFNYENGVYKMLNDQDLSGIILNNLYDDMLWGYRTKRNVSDKVACLLAIIPDLEITDDHGYLVNLKNGLLNIYTKELIPHTPDFVSLVQFPVEYNPNATCPTWDVCLDNWMAGPEEEQKRLILQQFSGYLLSSSMVHAKALFLVGDGGNGKSTFADTLGMVIGDAGTSRIDLEDLYSVFGLKGLIGKRLNIVEEVSGNYYQSHKLKKLVSGEELTINMKFKDQFKFRPQAKFIFAVNTMPRVDDSSTATERRIAVVNFNNNFRDNPNTFLRFDNGLLSKELSGILNWMIEGANILLREKKFFVTKEQQISLLEYREENSSVEGFIGECLEFKEGSSLSSRDLYAEYQEYCKKDGRKFKGNIAFIKEMKSHGKRNNKFQFVERESGHTPSKFEGIAMSADWSSSATGQRQLKEF